MVELRRRGLPGHSTVRLFRFPTVGADEDGADPGSTPHSHLCPPDHLRQVRHHCVTFGIPTAVYAVGNASGSIIFVLLLRFDEGALTRHRTDLHQRFRARAAFALDNPDGDVLEPKDVTPPSITHFGGANERSAFAQRTHCVRALRRAVDERGPVAFVGSSGTVPPSLFRIYERAGAEMEGFGGAYVDAGGQPRLRRVLAPDGARGAKLVTDAACAWNLSMYFVDILNRLCRTATVPLTSGQSAQQYGALKLLLVLASSAYRVWCATETASARDEVERKVLRGELDARDARQRLLWALRRVPFIEFLSMARNTFLRRCEQPPAPFAEAGLAGGRGGRAAAGRAGGAGRSPAAAGGMPPAPSPPKKRVSTVLQDGDTPDGKSVRLVPPEELHAPELHRPKPKPGNEARPAQRPAARRKRCVVCHVARPKYRCSRCTYSMCIEPPAVQFWTCTTKRTAATGLCRALRRFTWRRT